MRPQPHLFEPEARVASIEANPKFEIRNSKKNKRGGSGMSPPSPLVFGFRISDFSLEAV
jgi:hypothetical protein